MKRLVTALLVGALLVLSFTGCSKKGDCDFCDNKDVKVTEKEVLGEKALICDECMEDLNELKDALS